MPRLRSLAPLLAAAAILARSGSARAAPHPFHLSGDLGFAQLGGGPSGAGVGGGAQLAWSATDTFDLLAAFHVTAHPYPQWLIAGGGLGAVWNIDAADWVPWVGAVAGGALIRSTSPLCGAAITSPCLAFRLDLELPFGLDYRINKQLAVGAAGRFQMLLLGDVPWTTLGAYARVTYTFGR